MTHPILCETIGLEIETENISPKKLQGIGNFRVGGDASVESDHLTFRNIPVEINPVELRKKLSINVETIGCEIASGIIDTNQDYISDIKYLTGILSKNGECEESQRAGIHVHLSFGNINLNILKSIITLGAHLESVFFLLGGMGYDFRGIDNDSTYCRPITKWGPPIVKTRYEENAQCMDIKELLESKNVDDFRMKCGDLYNLGGNRYIPIRYMWLNLYNIWESKQTLEFRIFNKTLNPYYIYAIIEFCKKFGMKSIENAFSGKWKLLEENSVYDHQNREKIILTFLKFAEDSQLDNIVLEICLEILNKTPIESIRLSKKYNYSHLLYHRSGNKSPIHWRTVSYKPPIISDRCYKPKFMDIHNLRSEQGNLREEVLRSDPRQVFRERFFTSNSTNTYTTLTPRNINDNNEEISLADYPSNRREFFCTAIESRDLSEDDWNHFEDILENKFEDIGGRRWHDVETDLIIIEGDEFYNIYNQDNTVHFEFLLGELRNAELIYWTSQNHRECYLSCRELYYYLRNF